MRLISSPPSQIFHNFGRVIKDAALRFRDTNGFFLSSALAFDLLLYSLPLFLIGISVVSWLNLSGVKFITYFLSVFDEFLPPSQHQFNEIFSVKRSLGSGINAVGLALLFFISANLFGTVRIITRKVLGTHTHLRLIRAKILDIILMVVLGLFFGLSVLLTFGLQTFASAVSHFSDFVDVVSPTVLFFGGVIKLSLLVLIFYILFRIYSDREIKHTVVLGGSLLTTLLFETSKYFLNIYVLYAKSSTIVYGALGAFIFYFVWLYYSAVVFVFGGCLTWALSLRSPAPHTLQHEQVSL